MAWGLLLLKHGRAVLHSQARPYFTQSSQEDLMNKRMLTIATLLSIISLGAHADQAPADPATTTSTAAPASETPKPEQPATTETPVSK